MVGVDASRERERNRERERARAREREREREEKQFNAFVLQWNLCATVAAQTVRSHARRRETQRDTEKQRETQRNRLRQVNLRPSLPPVRRWGLNSPSHAR